MPPRVCTPECDVKRAQLTVNLTRPCKDCRKADSDIYDKLHQSYENRPTAQFYDRRLLGMPEPGATDGLPPTYHHATEQPPTYAQAIAEEEPVSYDNVMMAIATFQPDGIAKACQTFRAS